LHLHKLFNGRSPQAWWVKVPGVNFESGESLSPVAEQAIEIAVQKINHLLKTISKEQY
jgi:Ni,Fe-hydrogenase maturation factor